METEQFEITTESGRLDKVISEHFADWSRSQVKNAIEADQIKVNGKTEKPKYAVATGDLIEIQKPDPWPLMCSLKPFPWISFTKMMM